MSFQVRLVNNVLSSDWTDPANAFADDSLCTYTKTTDAVTYYNFINNPFTIPAGATITGLRLILRWGGDGDDKVYFMLVDDTGTPGIKGAPAPVAGCADAVAQYTGGDGDLWGGTWTPAHVNSANFVLRLLYAKTAKANFIYIDFLEVTVYYTTVGVVETITAQRFPMHYLSKPVKAQELISMVEGATITHTAKNFPETLLKKGKAQELRSKWV